MSHGSTRTAPAWPRGAAALGLLLLAAAAMPAARAATVSTLRLRLNPNAVANGALTADAQALLEAQLGTKVTPVGSTRTGAIELALETPQDSVALKPKLTALRRDRSILWVEPSTAGRGAPGKRATDAPPNHVGYVDVGSKLLVRLAGRR